jgi:hypothetical protein
MKNTAVYTFFLLFSLIVLAAPQQVIAQAASRAITIIPPRFELFANPGETLTEKIRVRNDTTIPMTYAIVVEDFATAGEEGHVVLEEDSLDKTFSLASWIDLDSQTLTLQPNEEVVFSFTIIVPKNAEPGGHYASVLFSSSAEAQVPGAAMVNQRIGSLILLRVSGNVVEEAKIDTFHAPTYSQRSPVNFVLRLTNNGNVHVQPKGTIVITNMFGRKVEELPLNGANVLPSATRKMETVWDKDSVFGTFTATLVATYGQQNLPITAATRFTVISTTAAILIGVGFLATIIFVVSLITGRKRLARALKVLASGK